MIDKALFDGMRCKKNSIHSLRKNRSLFAQEGQAKKFRMGQRVVSDMRGTFGMAPPDPYQHFDPARAMETLLKPLLGPAEAENALLQEDDDDESTGSDDSMMDDDDDDGGSDNED
jgi:hypothetical protein